MKCYNLQDMCKGWFIGNFEPTLLSTGEFEVAIKYYRAGDKENAHEHRIVTEYTVIVIGEVLMGGEIFKSGDIVVVPPGEAIDFEALTDAATTVVKVPSVQGDKYAVI